MSSRDKHRVRNVRHIIYAHSCLGLLLPQLHTLPYWLTYHTWSYFVMFVFSRVKYPVLIVRHMIYDHHCLWSCLPELHTMSLLFDISYMTILFYVCFFQSSIVCPYCSTFHLWSPLLMFMSSRDNITSLMFDGSSMIIGIHACVFRRSYMVSLMFDISPMVIILHACVFQRFIPCP